jgi:type IV pilus assembly protein PilO
MSRLSTIRERLFSPVGLYLTGFCILAVVTLVLGIRVVLDWRTTSASNADVLAGKQAQLKTLELQTLPLRGLDKKVDLSRTQISELYAERVPPSYSAILERLGQIAGKGPVGLTRVVYTPRPGSGDLAEIRMDVGLSGDYPAIMRFVNGIERSPTFFVIRQMSLTGQTSGLVNLRLQVSTWLRPDDVPKGLPVAPDAAGPDAASQPDGGSAVPAGEGR